MSPFKLLYPVKIDIMRFVSIKNFLLVIFTTVLLLAFGLHSIQIKHAHFSPLHSDTSSHHEHGTHHGKSPLGDLDIVMHIADKKLFLFILIALLTIIPFRIDGKILIELLASASRTTKVTCDRHGGLIRVHTYLAALFRRGIYHPKVF